MSLIRLTNNTRNILHPRLLFVLLFHLRNWCHRTKTWRLYQRLNLLLWFILIYCRKRNTLGKVNRESLSQYIWLCTCYLTKSLKGFRSDRRRHFRIWHHQRLRNRITHGPDPQQPISLAGNEHLPRRHLHLLRHLRDSLLPKIEIKLQTFHKRIIKSWRLIFFLLL